MAMLELPGRHHPLHVLGLLAKGKDMRFSQIVNRTGYFDAEVARALDYLKRDHLIRSKTVQAQGERVVLAYGVTARGRAAWESFEAYGHAIRARESVLGPQEVAAVNDVLAV
ncbi:MAG: hypothetical protein ACYDBQ_02915 [Thermoplasmatota archaeon]